VHFSSTNIPIKVLTACHLSATCRNWRKILLSIKTLVGGFRSITSSTKFSSRGIISQINFFAVLKNNNFLTIGVKMYVMYR
jgi:hypothetical protein